MSDFKTEQIANFTLALTTAFELLADYRESKLGKSYLSLYPLIQVSDSVTSLHLSF